MNGQIYKEISDKVFERAILLMEEPTNDLLELVTDCRTAIINSQETLTGAQISVDHGIALAAIGLIIATRATIAEDTLFKRENHDS